MEFTKILQRAVSELLMKLKARPDVSTDRHITVGCRLDSLDTLPIWLARQTVFPKFTWHSRDQHFISMGLGHAFCLEDDKAETFLKVPNEQGQHCYFISGFDVTEPSWQGYPTQQAFLPLIECIIRKDTLELHCHAVNKQQLVEAINCLDNLSFDTTSFNDRSEFEYRSDVPNRDGWKQNLEQAQLYFTSGELDKIVLGRETFIQQNTTTDFWNMFSQWQTTATNSYALALQLTPERGFMSFTPECLFQRKGNTLRTEALAGTVKRSNNPHDDNDLALELLQDEKNVHEHQLVIDDIKAKLHKLNIHAPTDSVKGLIKLNNVQHLYYPIEAQVNADVNDLTLLRTLHPTAAICGLPGDKAKARINAQEEFNRGWYAGCCGIISADYAEFAVTIRSARVEADGVYLYAGAGIVPASEIEREWQELNAKISTPLALFATEAKVVSSKT